jgi:hypothetical protein
VPLRPDHPSPHPPATSANPSSLAALNDGADAAGALGALLVGPVEAWGGLACLRYEGVGRAEDLRVGDVADLLRQYQALAVLVRRLACHTRQAAPLSTPLCTQGTDTGIGDEVEQRGGEIGSSHCGDRCAAPCEVGGGAGRGGGAGGGRPVPGKMELGGPTCAE